MEGVGSALRSVISRVKEVTAKRSSVRVLFLCSVQCQKISHLRKSLCLIEFK